MTYKKRKKFFVSQAIQGRMLLRLSGYFVFYTLFVWHVFYFIEAVIKVPPELRGPNPYFAFMKEHAFLLLLSLSVFPIVLLDMIKFSNRVAGPFVRFERALKSMIQGERIEPITLRKNDMVDEFRDVFNEFVVARNRELDKRTEQTESVVAESEASVLLECNVG